MSRIYDNWERLVAAVLRKEQLWQLCYADSIEPSIRSVSLAYTSSFSLSSPISDVAARDVRLLQKNEEYDVVVPRDRFLRLDRAYEAVIADVVSRTTILETLKMEKFAVPYKAVMDNGVTTVVKRLRRADMSRRVLGEVSRSINPENVAPQKAYFSYKDEMLIIYEYQSQDNVSTMLQGKKLGKYLQLDWESRLRIAICVSMAIANKDIKARDVFLNSQNNDCFSYLGLENMAAASIVVSTAGYIAPEVSYNNSPSEESDIYSFGVLLLELLTGTFPMKGSVVDRMHLVLWVTQKFLEAGTLIVFEFVPVKNPSSLIEMWKVLLVAMRCVEENPKQRPKLSEVVKMMENIRTVHSRKDK